MPIIDVNGELIDFPDSMSDLEIEAVLQKQFPPKQIPQGDVNDNFIPKELRAGAYGLAGGQVPFGNVITSGIGASIAYPFTPKDMGFKQLYNQAQADTKAVQEESPLATLVGNALGIATTFPAAFSKPVQGSGIIATPAKGLQALGNFTTKMAGATPFKGGGLSALAGNTIARGLGGAAVAAPIGGLYTAGEADAGQRGDAFLEGAGTGAAIGFALPVAGTVLGAAGRGIGRMTTPAISEAGKNIAELAKKYNIPMGLDDLTDSSFYKTMISEGKTLPFSGSNKKSQEQMSSWMSGVAKSIGANTDKLTPDVILNRFDEIGAEFNNFFKGKKINLGEDYGLGLRQRDFIDSVAENYTADGKNIIEKYTGQINKAIQKDGVIDGEALGAIRNRVSKIARESKNQEISGAARDVENFIIDAVADVSDEGAREAFKKAKYQYKNLIAIEPLTQKAQVSGEISPAQLLGRVRQVYGREFTKGRAGELGDLANIGQYIKETIPNSGTSQRTMARNILTGNALGAIPTFAFGGPVAAAAQAGLSGLAMLANRGIQSRNFNPKLIESGLEKLSKQSPQLENKGLRVIVNKTPIFTKEK